MEREGGLKLARKSLTITSCFVFLRAEHELVMCTFTLGLPMMFAVKATLLML